MIHGSPSTKLQKTQTVSSVFVTEAAAHLLAFSFAALFSEIYLMYRQEADPNPVSSLAFWTAGAFFVCCILEHIFRLFVPGLVSVFFSVIPSLVLVLMLRRFDVLLILQAAIILAAAMRIFTGPAINRRFLFAGILLLLDIISLYLYFTDQGLNRGFLSEKILCICLVTLTMYSLQSVLPREGALPFPIHLFLCIGILSGLIPMKSAPIDWTPVIEIGEKIASGIENTADNASYFFSTAFGGTYTAGYSSLSGNGDRLQSSERVQLFIETDSLPYHTFRNEETKSYEKVRKTLYLAGGSSEDTAGFISFLNLLYQNNVDRAAAGLFSEQESLDLEYVYLDTFDEIAPSTAFMLTAWGRRVKSGVSTSMHRKGYRLSARYLDIDYASPYLANMLRSETGSRAPSYKDACSYAGELWGIDLTKVLGKDEYEKTLRDIEKREKDIKETYLDVTGADEKLSALADDITKGSSCDYDKCRQIEAFLRQYAYSRDSVGGYDESSDMSTSRGMADISDRFLFDTARGYCIHFTSSMVMLLRLSGIPARAVSGYRYAFPFEKADEYSVSSSCAHTWPEAYISGAGWIPFEPTSGYYSQSEGSWHRYPDAQQGKTLNALSNVPMGSAADSGESVSERDLREKSVLIAFKVLWPFIVSAICLVLLLIAGTRFIMFLRYKYASPTKKLLIDVDIIKRSLVRLSGQKIMDRGFLSDYVCLAPSDMQKDLEAVFIVCYRILYGSENENSPTPYENDLAKSVREKVSSKTHGRAVHDINETSS